ncbi:CsiV family protein [Amphritea japonica]|uniref:Peptidoglycan-binding LysM n=1 Tax=Amphritea japonica ATCC BAA-1530 TaxID=1278309 RepID=A0A7R6PBN2_9GAMM|nr:CsiV family protein [Amphritea japonica]BBB26076.1 conserved hypothetical protein [Amphritea japonica ATCC BAA-1530]
MIKLYSGFLLALSLTLVNSAPVHAAASDYKVEVLAFSHLSSDTLDDEIWPVIETLPSRRSRALKYYKKGQQNGYFTRLPKSSLSLSAKQASLKRSSLYKVLFHEAWIQPINSRKDQYLIRINGGEVLDNGLYELDGYISVDKGRYLHFRSDLFHSRSLSPAESTALLKTSTETTVTVQEPLPESADTLPDTTSELSSESMNGNRYLNQTAIPDFLTVEMKSARRMRRAELHYLDHPLFGVLVRITPIE